MSEKTYTKRGVFKAKKIVRELYKRAEVASHFGYYLYNPENGSVLSPICVGENTAWIFAALLISISKGYTMIDFLDDTYVDEITGEEYKEN